MTKNFNRAKFRDWLNRYLQSPSLQLPSGISANINERTVQHYMLALGFTYKRFQQGLQYTDGHERDNARLYRGLYLENLTYLKVLQADWLAQAKFGAQASQLAPSNAQYCLHVKDLKSCLQLICSLH